MSAHLRAAAAAGVVALGALVIGGALAQGAAASPAATGQEPDFWEAREAAYRESPRGPFTAIRSEYLEAGKSVLLFASDDAVWTFAETGEAVEGGDPDPATVPGPKAGVRIEFGAEGFVLSPVPAHDPPTKGGEPIAGPVAMGTSADDEEDLRLGRYPLSLGLQGGTLARVVVYDPALLENFHGFPVFADDEAYRVTARVLPGSGETVELGTTRGLVKRYVRAAVLEFEVGGTACRLTGFRAPGDEGPALFVPFRDATSGGESYGVGRYLRVEPSADGTAAIDFNHATNPWCAYSPFYNCVLPPKENELEVEIRAGERAPEDH